MRNLLLALSAASEVGAQTTSNISLTLVDLMNAFLILISTFFMIAIVSMLLNRKLLDVVRSAHFFQMKKIIAVWSVLGLAILLYGLNEILFILGVLTNLSVYKFMKTLFGVFLVAGLLLLYTVLRRYVNQFSKKKKEKKKEKA